MGIAQTIKERKQYQHAKYHLFSALKRCVGAEVMIFWSNGAGRAGQDRAQLVLNLKRTRTIYQIVGHFVV
jgi:hypothetical protein